MKPSVVAYKRERIAAVPGRAIDVVTLASFPIKRMPYFIVPRYIRIMDELPKTPTAKVLKTDLGKDGVTTDTFDRERAGMRLRREVLA